MKFHTLMIPPFLLFLRLTLIYWQQKELAKLLYSLSGNAKQQSNVSMHLCLSAEEIACLWAAEVLINSLIPSPWKPWGHALDLSEIIVDLHSLQIKYAMCSWPQQQFYEPTKLPTFRSLSEAAIGSDVYNKWPLLISRSFGYIVPDREGPDKVEVFKLDVLLCKGKHKTQSLDGFDAFIRSLERNAATPCVLVHSWLLLLSASKLKDPKGRDITTLQYGTKDSSLRNTLVLPIIRE